MGPCSQGYQGQETSDVRMLTTGTFFARPLMDDARLMWSMSVGDVTIALG